MSYTATVYHVMIASPGDVPEEREAIAQAVYSWNATHTEHRKIVLLPIRWETHSVPASGAPPQTLINQQMVHSSDLLVAVFGNRMGTPTTKALSGTVEEIEVHEAAGKQVMLYFSNADIPRQMNADQRAQLAAVEDYRRQRQGDALYETYATTAEFQTKFGRQLTRLLNMEPFLTTIPSADITAPPDPFNGLTNDAFELLETICIGDNNTIMNINVGTVRRVMTPKRELTRDAKHPREFARWQGALDELVEKGLARDKGTKGEVYEITGKGYRFYEQIKPLPVEQQLSDV